MENLLIFPYNGNALEAVDCIGSNYNLIGFIDDDIEKHGVQKNGFEVFSRDILYKYPKVKLLAVPGNPLNYKFRQTIIDDLKIPHDRFATLIHSRACISKFVNIGFNVLIMAGVIITSNVVIGNHVCILPNTVIHHDDIIEDYCLIGSSVTVAGGTVLRKNCYIGSGSNIINNIEIGEKTLVGLGSNVINSIKAFSKAVGNPARIIETIK